MSVNTTELGFAHLPHYSTHAREFILEIAAGLERQGVEPHLETFFALCLERAVKFLLPDNGMLFAEHDYKPAMFELQRLPYPICVVEFKANEELYAEGSGLHRSDKRIALCFDPHQLDDQMSALLAKSIRKPLSALPSRCLFITTIYDAKEEDAWCPAMGFASLNLDEDKPIPLNSPPEAGPPLIDFAEQLKDQVRGLPSKHGLPCSFYPDPLRAAMVGHSVDEALRSLYLDTLDEIRVVFEFLAALNCTNVGSQEIPAPGKLNAKRAKNGKTPFYAYKVLDLAGIAGYQPGAGGSGGASPRTHLRRGHLRHLGEKYGYKVLWINATTVNLAKGDQVQTVYKVRP